MCVDQIRKRQIESVQIAKLKGIYKERVEGSKEDVYAFLDKPKNKHALEYTKKRLLLKEAAKL